MARLASLRRGGLLLGVFCLAVTMTLASADNTTEVVEEGAGGMEGVNCGDGLVVPIWRPFHNLSAGDRFGRGLLYALLMVYLFIGVSIVSDRFMESIEMITAQEKELTLKDPTTGKNQVIVVKVWNETVANLTLMALGSSAPEILLSVVEIYAKGFVAGELGPGTIVGSAAFNLFMIIGLCMYVIPDDEVRKIKHLRVFLITATWSVFAYVWLYCILGPISYGVVEVWEGLLTFLFFPLTVWTAYVADRRLFCYKYMAKSYRMGDRGVIIQTEKDDIEDRGKEKFKDLDEDMDPALAEFERHRREYINAMKRIRLENPNIDMAELELRAREEVMSKGPKSRAYYRIQATRKLAGKQNLDKKLREKLHEEADKKQEDEAKEEEEEKKDDGVMRLFFDPPHYTVMENIGTFEATVVREGGDLNVAVQVDFKTEDGTALAGPDYIEKVGTLYFAPGVTEQKITLEVLDDDVFEEDEHFYCRITNLRRKDGIEIHNVEIEDENGSPKTVPCIQLGTPALATIMVLDDDHGGVFQFENHELDINEAVGTLELKVDRISGARGKVGIPYTTEEGTAKAGKDYTHVEGELIFANEENAKTIEIPIIEEDSYEKNCVMYVVIGEPRHIAGPPGEGEGVNYDDIDAKDPEDLTEVEKIAVLGRPRLGDITKVQIRIKESKEFKSSVDRMMQRGNASMVMGASSWRDQFMEAFTVQAGDDDEEEEGEDGEEAEEKMPTCGDYIMHFLTLFWKVIFSIIPPAGLMKGYPCFVVSIMMIGVCTAVIGDVAGHLGCFIYLKDQVNAIAFVALGTSVPDTFASKVAAIQDDTADASVGNVTGSNAVNVFLGIGIAWSMAAVYWWANGTVFFVKPGSLGFSVAVFCTEALIAILILLFRRNPAVGGELGGPKSVKTVTSSIFVCLWLTYVMLSALEAYKVIDPGF
ncbi:sodium/calcium exchanger 3-like isoform X2 [Tigriopus californicus]|uniref:sodium/calcium exchanger 3-like isoform X2 n=1 Tax=Tigriopus californicus TaxID=6832 RepID=UPI0027D9D7B8|nr:sodium/calcium exchanger 3-like isoform X2 [Tigriopus californicus]